MSRSAIFRVVSCAFLVARIAPGQTTAPASQPSARIVRTDHPPKIDGRLDDLCWEDAAVISQFKQVLPSEGAPPTERTEVRLCYDADNLYVGVRCFDSQPAEVRAKQMARDGNTGSDDVLRIVIDTFHDRRNGYFFSLTAGGSKLDGLIESGGTFREEWDGIWYGKSHVDDQGWTCEFAIPMKTVSFDRQRGEWGFNIERVVRRKQETDRWAGASANLAIENIGEAGTIEDLRGLQQGIGLTLHPFLATNVDLKDGSSEWKPGFDLFYKIRPSVTAALTVNTDFAEAEVDERRVNLTRFPLFFPEKREFFLQDTTIFSFGGLGFSPLPFFSRRIGIVNGEQKDILAGLKITGREQNVNFGLLDVQMYDDDVLGQKNLAVARASVNVLSESTVGVIVTNGDPSTPDDNTLGGFDFNFRNSHVNGDHVIDAHAWVLGSHSSNGEVGDDGAFGGNFAWPNDDFYSNLFFEQIGQNFNPALGFVERTGVREYDWYNRVRWRPTGFIHRIDLSIEPLVYTELNNRVQSMAFTLPGIEFEDRFGDECGAWYEFDRENLDASFAIHEGITLPTGDYSWRRVGIYGVTTRARPVSVYAEARFGGFYDGYRQDYETNIEWRPAPQFFGAIGGEIDDIHLEEGNFIVRIFKVRANVLFSPQASWNNIVQYDNVSGLIGLNSRIRYEFEPGREMFVVLNQSLLDERGSFKTVRSELAVKIGLTFRF